MTNWVEENMDKIAEGDKAQRELSEKIVEFMKAASGSSGYYGTQRGSLKLVDEGAGKFITGKVSLGGDRFGDTYRDFKISLDDLDDVDAAIKRREELKRMAERNIF